MNPGPPDHSLIGEVQKFGLLSAATVVDRYARMIDAATSEATAPSYDLTETVARVAGSYLSFLDTAAALAVSPTRRDALLTERLILPPVRPPGRSHVTLWLHNPTSDTVPSVEVTVTALSTVEGDGVGVETISVSPSVVSLPPRTRRSLLVQVDVAPDQPSGSYHGWAVASVAPDEPLPLHLRVENGEAGT